ncbi:ATP-dependent zinc protease family protein [Algivirga pacifica]|uniref:ATP-dependent zinc protease n=1 Tax=Algivirga pacifica TaxID=1162670 RepID=A0ABP9DFB3_9BACT
MKKTTKQKEKLLIGSTDHVDLPSFDLADIPCKIDTGAETSAIHCHRVKLVEKDGEEFICFQLLDPSHKQYNGKEFRTNKFEERKVRSSSGVADYRYVITTEVELFGQRFETEFTLADREKMKFPILLGKRLLKKNFLVDVSKNNLSFKKKQTETSL